MVSRQVDRSIYGSSILGTMIVAAIGDLSSSLWNAGVSIMNGLLDGLKKRLEHRHRLVVGTKSRRLERSGRRDKRCCISRDSGSCPASSRGLDEGWDDVTRQLSGYVPSITGGGSLAGAGVGAAPIIRSSRGTRQMERSSADAQAGGQFARSFAPEFDMRRS